MYRNAKLPSVKTLSRQFLASYLNLYAGILVASTLVIVVVEMMLNLDDALDFEQGAAGVASYLLLRVPSYYLPYLIPVGSFAAAFLCLGLPARAREILALKAGGVAPQRICVPVLVAAAVISVGALLLNETIVRKSYNKFNHLNPGGEIGSIFQSSGGFWYQRAGTFYYIREADRDTRTVRGVRIYEPGTDGRLHRSIEAESARIGDDDRWHLHHVTIRTFSSDPAAAPTVEHVDSRVLDMASRRELALLDADASSLNLLDLHAYIQAARRDGRDTARYRALFYERLADPLSVLLFALLAMPLGLAVERSRSLPTAAIQGVVLLAVFYTLKTTGAIAAAGGVAAAVPVPWIVLLLFGSFGAWRFARLPA